MRIYAPLNSEPEPVLLQIEVATFFQLPSFQIVGLPSPEVAEARERVRSAIEASGIEFPRRRVVLNLSPASLKKRGTGLDLPMALAILLLGSEKNDEDTLGAWGELGLDGKIKPAGQITRALYAAWHGGVSYLIVSTDEIPAASAALEWIRQSGELEGAGPRLVGAASLSEASEKVLNRKTICFSEQRFKAELESLEEEISPGKASHFLLPLGEALERMIGVAVAGCHHLLLLGPRGTGKTQTLEWVVALQPKASPQDRLRQQLLFELTRSSPDSDQNRNFDQAPIRRVGTQVRPGALTGGVSLGKVRPGEYSLAHGGVLVADELPEWSRDSRESLREPLEKGRVTLTRVQGAVELPSQFVLAANGNLCPCGGWPKHLSIPISDKNSPRCATITGTRCKCTDSSRAAYLSRLSGPLLDRIDMTLLLAEPVISTASKDNIQSKIISLRRRVESVRVQLKEKWGGSPGFLTGAQIEAILERHSDLRNLLTRVPCASLRSRHKMLRLALTLSAWDGKDMPHEGHFSEASYYRSERYLFFD